MRRLLLLALLPAACCEPNATERLWRKWLGEDEPVANAYRHTRAELAAFDEACADLAPAWARTTQLHASLARLVVLDARHVWHGMGDSFGHWAKLLRLGRSLGRASFLWTDPCADRDGPPRPDVPSELCRFDPGAYVHGLGGLSWRWTAKRRQAAEGLHGGELELRYVCHNEGQERCRNASVLFINGSVAAHAAAETAEAVAEAVVQLLHSPAVAAHPWLRLVLPYQGTLQPEADAPRTCALSGEPDCLLRYRCGAFASWRPRPRVWAALRPALQRMESWVAVAALTVRSGLADHFDTLGGLELPVLSPAALAAQTSAIFTQCPNGSIPLWRERKPDVPPCVNWVGPDRELHLPDAGAARRCGGANAFAEALLAETDPGLYRVWDGPLGSHTECAWRRAAALASDEGEPGAWGILFFSDSPALRCALEASPLTAAGKAYVPTSMPGHNRYAPPGPVLAAVGLGVVADFYLLALATPPVHAVFSSAFSGVALSRTCHGERFPRSGEGQPFAQLPPNGYEQWFQTGRDKTQGAPQGGHASDAAMRALLAATHARCPAQAAATAAALELYARHRPAEG